MNSLISGSLKRLPDIFIKIFKNNTGNFFITVYISESTFSSVKIQKGDKTVRPLHGPVPQISETNFKNVTGKKIFIRYIQLKMLIQVSNLKERRQSNGYFLITKCIRPFISKKSEGEIIMKRKLFGILTAVICMVTILAGTSAMAASWPSLSSSAYCEFTAQKKN